jgi:hypothetical protein
MTVSGTEMFPPHPKLGTYFTKLDVKESCIIFPVDLKKKTSLDVNSLHEEVGCGLDFFVPEDPSPSMESPHKDVS